MSEWTIQSTIRLFFEKWNSVKKCPRYVWIQKCPKMAFFSAKNQEILKMSHFYLNELSLTIRTGFLWVNVTIWHWVCSNIPKIKDFRGYHPSFGTYFNFRIFGCFYWAPRPYFSEFPYENQWVSGQYSQLSDYFLKNEIRLKNAQDMYEYKNVRKWPFFPQKIKKSWKWAIFI